MESPSSEDLAKLVNDKINRYFCKLPLLTPVKHPNNVCKICKGNFGCLTMLRTHAKRKSRCDFCSRDFECHAMLMKHAKKFRTCICCSEVFDCVTLLEKHAKKNGICEICRCDFKCDRLLKKHYKRDSYCDFCSKDYECHTMVKNHAKKNSSCGICCGEFGCPRLLRKHAERDSICEICHGDFKCCRLLRRHDKRESTCNFCMKDYECHTMVKNHAKRSTGTCKMCNGEFGCHRMLRKHAMKNSTCSICNGNFKCYSLLRKHAEKNSNCNVCRANLRCQTLLRKHKLKCRRQVSSTCIKKISIEINGRTLYETSAGQATLGAGSKSLDFEGTILQPCSVALERLEPWEVVMTELKHEAEEVDTEEAVDDGMSSNFIPEPVEEPAEQVMTEEPEDTSMEVESTDERGTSVDRDLVSRVVKKEIISCHQKVTNRTLAGIEVPAGMMADREENGNYIERAISDEQLKHGNDPSESGKDGEDESANDPDNGDSRGFEVSQDLGAESVRRDLNPKMDERPKWSDGVNYIGPAWQNIERANRNEVLDLDNIGSYNGPARVLSRADVQAHGRGGKGGKPNCCPFCHKWFTHLQRHLHSVKHAGERHKLFTAWRGEGDIKKKVQFLRRLTCLGNADNNRKVRETGRGVLIAMRAPKNCIPVTNFVRCYHCLGEVNKFTFVAHAKLCIGREVTLDENNSRNITQ